MLNPQKYSITFACHNSIEYTKLCVESMLKNGTPLNRLVVVDNGSRDTTRSYLETLELGGRIYNSENLGCGVAWNQGVLKLQSEWSIVINNDVLVSPNWIENLITTAEQLNLKVISPALIEGPLDYDFDNFERNAQRKMENTHRIGARHAVCLAIHKSVWLDAGYFLPIPKLLGYEDTLFFNELDKNRITTGMTGAAWLHHFGSITQSAMKQERGLRTKDGLSNRQNYKLLNQSLLKRKLIKFKKKRAALTWREDEIKKYGQTIHGLRENGIFKWI